MEEKQTENLITYHITKEQAEKICNYSGLDAFRDREIEDYEICEALDHIIDELPDKKD